MAAKGEDECGPYPHKTRQDSGFLPQQVCYKTHSDGEAYQHPSNIIPHNPPKFSSFSIEDNRLKTFNEKSWPVGLTQKPEQLAKAGFYYTGVSDQVLCFYCDGGLQNWEPNDDPWEEHAKHFPRCGFLNVMRSPQYVRNVQEGFNGNAGYNIERSHSSTSGSSNFSNTSTESAESRRLSSEDDLSKKSDVVRRTIDTELQKENERLKDERLCKICADKELGVVLIPCAHFVTCTSCAASLTRCPVCRSTITSLVKTYLS